MDEMEKNELEKNEELEPKEAAETKEEPTQEEASVTDAPAAEEAVETAEEPVTAEASAEETAEEPEIEETEELKQEEPKQEEQPAEVPAAQKAEKGGVLGIVIGLIALIAIVAYAWMNPMGKAVDTGILYTKDDNLYYYDLKNEPYQVQEGLSNGGTYHYFYTAWGASVTEDGSYLYFSDDIDENGAFVLYRRDAKNADAKAAQIDTDVYDYMASKDGKVVAYLKKSGETYALCVYDGKQVQRDEIRKAMKNGEGFEPLLQECYVLTGGKSVRVAGDVVAAVGVDSKQTYVAGYKTKEFTPMHLSVMDGGLDMVEYIYYMSLNYGGMEVFLADTTGKVNLLSGSQPQLDGLKLSENGKKAAYLDTDANTGDTILVEIELGKEKAETVATNVQSFGYIGNTLIYYFDYTEGVGTLGAAGSKTTIANASGVQFTEDAVYYVADADAATGNGELRAWDGKTETAIAKDVFAFQYKENGKLVYIGKYDVNAGVGDLYYYDGKKARKLDTGITAIFIY